MVQRTQHHWVVALLTAGLAVFLTASTVHSLSDGGLRLASEGEDLPPAWCNGAGDACDRPDAPFFCKGPGRNEYGDCCYLHEVAGCERSEIEDCVCGQDEFCCSGRWD